MQPFRVLVQLPDAFNPDQPCLVVAPASGSRGVYGAIPLVGPWALVRGCAVAYTDKGAGTDYFDYADGSGVGLDGVRIRPDQGALGFLPRLAAADEASDRVAMPHAHSGDHPEADWGQHVLEAARFGLDVLEYALDAEFGPNNTRILATGLSNGAGAVLRAAEQDAEGLIDAVVAVMPNISPSGVPHLYAYATEAALYQPCMLADLEATLAMPLGNPLLAAAGQQRCAALSAAGLLDQPEPALARQRLLDAGFDEAALNLAPVNVALDLWRSVLVGYASAYLGTGAFDMPCDYAMAAPAASPAQRQAWWANHSGIGPGGGIELIDGRAEDGDRALPGLICLKELLESDGREGEQLRASIEATRASARLPDIPVLIVHGRDDGLIPVVFSARPYVEQARAKGASLAYWEVANSQHFDAVLAAPGVADRLVPILPYGWYALDRIEAVLDGQAELGPDRSIETTPAPAGQALEWSNLGLER
jgi:hydroxybutyrate-dimer hydrolase